MKLSLILFACFLFCGKVFAQVSPRVQGLESDSLYMSLLNKESTLTAQQDSLRELIKVKRAELTASTDAADKGEKANEIMNLETKLFDIRGTLGEITTKTNLIEKDFIIKNMNAATDGELGIPTSSLQVKANLIQNEYFAKNVTKTDYQKIIATPKVEKEIDELVIQIKTAYEKYTLETEAFKKAGDKNAADSIKALRNTIEEEILEIDYTLGALWKPLYQTKYDTYNMLLDKMSAESEIETLGFKSRDIRSEITSIQPTVAAPELAAYLRGCRLLLDYEIALAKKKNIAPAIDSLDKVLKKTDVAKNDLTIIPLPKWTFINYEPLKINTTNTYSEENPIPELIIPTVGDLYKIEIGSYPKKPTSYTVFRKISPIEYQESDGGKLTYYAGSYKTQEEAQKDYDKLRRLGMKVSIAHWRNAQQLAQDGSVIEFRPAGDAYRIEIATITDAMREIIKTEASGKEITNIQNETGSAYSIGLFDSFDAAKAVAVKLSPEAKVVGIKLD